MFHEYIMNEYQNCHEFDINFSWMCNTCVINLNWISTECFITKVREESSTPPSPPPTHPRWRQKFEGQQKSRIGLQSLSNLIWKNQTKSQNTDIISIDSENHNYIFFMKVYWICQECVVIVSWMYHEYVMNVS